VLLAVDQLCVEALPKEAAAAAVAPVEAFGVRAVHEVHGLGHAFARRLDDQVVVRPHRAARTYTPVEALGRPIDELIEIDAVGILAIEQFVARRARRDVVQTVG
jgi:hypothetical protein